MDLEKLLAIVPDWSLFAFDDEPFELVGFKFAFEFELESVSTSSPACFPLETSICPSLSTPDPSFCIPIPADLLPFPLIGRLLIGVGGMTVLENCFFFTIHKVHVQFESRMA
jgi:hypothetical protein